jgi:hypothetical protein
MVIVGNQKLFYRRHRGYFKERHICHKFLLVSNIFVGLFLFVPSTFFRLPLEIIKKRLLLLNLRMHFSTYIQTFNIHEVFQILHCILLK